MLQTVLVSRMMATGRFKAVEDAANSVRMIQVWMQTVTTWMELADAEINGLKKQLSQAEQRVTWMDLELTRLKNQLDAMPKAQGRDASGRFTS
jgi:hypothetical protein